MIDANIFIYFKPKYKALLLGCLRTHPKEASKILRGVFDEAIARLIKEANVTKRA